MAKVIVSDWTGVVLLDRDRVVREVLAPTEVPELAERLRLRLAGGTTPEEERLLRERGEEEWRTSDRRLARSGVIYDARTPRPGRRDPDLRRHREVLLRRAEVALADAWDPSIHVEEAVRALRDVDRAANLLGERVRSWAARDRPELEGAEAVRAAQALLEPHEPAPLGPQHPALTESRRRLAALIVALGEARGALDEAVRAAVPTRAPNLDRLLGPELAAQLIAQAGGLERLAHLPASTVQVLGAERAFFEHLRGRAGPPRHGLLFLHPAIQSAPRSQRGKLARALAAKAAIAARLDRQGTPVNPTIAQAFERRRAAIRAERRGGDRQARRPRSGLPLDGAARDR